jgi:hypothetical protein
MIDSQTESIITLAQAADQLPKRRRGRKTHISTLYRWATAGCRGIVLETLQVGACRCTSLQALQRFFERLSASVHVGAVPGPGVKCRTLAQRRRASDEAGRKLAETGA